MTSRAKVDEVLVIGGGVDNPGGISPTVCRFPILASSGEWHRPYRCFRPSRGQPDIDDDALAHALNGKTTSPARKVSISISKPSSALRRPLSSPGKNGSGPRATICQSGWEFPARQQSRRCCALPRFPASGHRCDDHQTGPQCDQTATVQSPHMLIAGLAEAMAADSESRLHHFHYYPFGGLPGQRNGLMPWPRAISHSKPRWLLRQ